MALAKTYGGIEFPFADADNPILKFFHHKPHIIATVGGCQNFVSVFMQQNQWREGMHSGVLWLVDRSFYTTAVPMILFTIAHDCSMIAKCNQFPDD